jgi:hypothetical protein
VLVPSAAATPKRLRRVRSSSPRAFARPLRDITFNVTVRYCARKRGKVVTTEDQPFVAALSGEYCG